MLARCVHCDAELVAPVRSEYWSGNHACHIWLCPKCCACFSSVVSFPADIKGHSQAVSMTRFGRSSLEVAVAVGTIMLGTVLVHFLMSWWPTLAALI